MSSRTGTLSCTAAMYTACDDIVCLCTYVEEGAAALAYTEPMTESKTNMNEALYDGGP